MLKCRSGYRIIVFMMMIISSITYAESRTATGGRTITRVEVTGLKRTRLRVIEEPLRRFVGSEAGSINHDDVFAVVLGTGILDPLDVSFRDEADGTALVVAVREKWSFFPVPFVVLSTDSLMAGGAVADMNAFGLNDKMALFGAYTTGGWMASVMYLSTSDRAGLPGWSLSGFYTSRERKDSDQAGDVYRRFHLDLLGVSAGLNYTFAEHFTASLSTSFQQVVLGDPAASDNAWINAPSTGHRSIGINPGISFSKSDYDGVFYSERSVSLSYDAHIGIDADSPPAHAISLRANFARPLISGLRLNARAGGVVAPQSNLYFEAEPANAIDIVPGDFSVQHFAGASLGLEKHLHSFSFGKLSALLAYQTLLSHGETLGTQFDHGPAAGIRLYLSKLAIPAFGAGLAYNMAARHFQGTFSMGMSM